MISCRIQNSCKHSLFISYFYEFQLPFCCTLKMGLHYVKCVFVISWKAVTSKFNRCNRTVWKDNKGAVRLTWQTCYVAEGLLISALYLPLSSLCAAFVQHHFVQIQSVTNTIKAVLMHNRQVTLHWCSTRRT